MTEDALRSALGQIGGIVQCILKLKILESNAQHYSSEMTRPLKSSQYAIHLPVYGGLGRGRNNIEHAY